MDPFTLMSMLGMGTNLLGNIFGPQETMPTQINPLTDQYYQQILQELQGYNAQAQEANQRAGQAGRQIDQARSQAQDTTEQISNVDIPDANAWFDDLMETQLPGYRQEAQRVAELATRGGSAGQAQRAQQMAEQGARIAANQMAGQGGMYSGATQAAVAEGAMNPLAQYENALGQQYQNAFMDTYTPLAQQGQGLAYQGQQDQFLNTMNQLGQMLGGQQLQGNMANNNMAGALQQANMFNQRALGAEAARQDIAQPFYATPNYMPNALSNFGNNLAQFGAIGSAFSGDPTGSRYSGGEGNDYNSGQFAPDSWMNNPGGPYGS